MREKNSTYLYIGNVSNEFTASNQDVDYTTLPAGSLALINADGLPVSEEDLITAIPTQKYCIVAKTAQSEIRKSPVFSSADVVSANLVNYFAPREQVSFIGYDGTNITGFDTTFVVGDSYRILYDLKHSQSVCNTTADLITAPYYALGTTQAAAAKALMESTINVFKKRGIKPLIVDRVALTTSVDVIDATAVVYKVTNGSKNVTGHLFNQAAGATRLLALTAQNIGALTAGDIIAFPSYNGRTFTATIDQNLGGEAGAYHIIIGTTNYVVPDAGLAAVNLTAIKDAINAGTQATASEDAAVLTITYKEGVIAPPPIIGYRATTDAGVLTAVAVTHATTNDRVPIVYKVESTIAAANNFNLDMPWQGPTGYIRTAVSADAAASLIATTCGIATLNAAGLWGLKFTGNTPMAFNPITETYDVSTFKVLGGDLGTEYKSIKSHRGVGTYREVVSMENLHQGEDRHYYADSMTTRREFTAEPGKYYDMLTINLRNQNHSSPATGIAEYNYATLVLAIDRSLSYETLDAAFGLTAITLT